MTAQIQEYGLGEDPESIRQDYANKPTTVSETAPKRAEHAGRGMIYAYGADVLGSPGVARVINSAYRFRVAGTHTIPQIFAHRRADGQPLL